jgi:hypothetical protein
MIEYIREKYGIRKVAVVDTDCHHGDGTQDVYWHDPETLFMSIHQDGRTLYPGTGFANELGGPNGLGTTVNIPLPPNTGEKGFLYTLDELVLPILHRYGPELVINSAGQDNHFNDPITHMNFSAQGYAILNARLKPHIAVLEGGYAVESALPYVNMGIIMAMAGMDTSFVKEPNYDRDYKPQPADVTAYIERLVDQLKGLHLGGRLQSSPHAKGKIVERERGIFYDTDGIREKQNERIRVCKACSGALAIDSSSSLGNHILAVAIPRNACDECRKTGLQWFEKGQSGPFDHVYLQDRPQKEYVAFTPRDKSEVRTDISKGEEGSL